MSFQSWYWRVIKKSFVVWLIILSVLGEWFVLSVLRDIAIADDVVHRGNHGVLLMADGVLILAVPVVCTVLAFVLASRHKRSELERGINEKLNDDEQAKATLEQIFKVVPFL